MALSTHSAIDFNDLWPPDGTVASDGMINHDAETELDEPCQAIAVLDTAEDSLVHDPGILSAW
jgi:hypothetical protein